MAYALRFSGEIPGTYSVGSAERRSAPSLSKRGVVAFRKRPLRSVESECGRTPKEVLSGTFQNLRRAASTKISKRMSWRFARTTRDGRVGDRQEVAVSEDWAWRPIGDVALNVMRSAALSAAIAKVRKSGYVISVRVGAFQNL